MYDKPFMNILPPKKSCLKFFDDMELDYNFQQAFEQNYKFDLRLFLLHTFVCVIKKDVVGHSNFGLDIISI